MRKILKVAWAVFKEFSSVMLILLLAAGVYTNMLGKKPTQVVRDVNASIIEMIQNGQESKVYDFYDKIVGNRQLTVLIVSTAMLYKIPVNYLVALAYTESRFDPNAVNSNKTKDGVVWSYDYGLFQLNSETFKQCSKEYLMVPENNTRLAAQFLIDRLARYGNWYETLISYNAGGTDLVKNQTIKHLVSVLTMHESLDAKFVTEF